MKKANIVFVHGLWADGSCWNEVAPALMAEGHEVISVQNPLSSLADDVAAVRRAFAKLDGPIVLVGHSWGGVVITAAGTNPKVKALVYVAALAPDEGETIGELTKDYQTAVFQHLEVVDDYIWVTREGIQKHFASDLTEKESELIYYTQGPAAAGLFVEKMTAPAWKNTPNWYILATNDEAVSPELQRIMSKRIGATVTEIESSHVPMISKPQEVLQVIKAAIDSL
ncbi:alpha/beta fold hydrolase [Flavobacterium aestivum]|uniref:alpha/beta fold hydrolase n=1 Tax=Flavobacterium aestivum TaxID=3003257 RepID=UPI002286740E|nr:alpha/beta hydrolase [Flavobacterium aestivum]